MGRLQRRRALIGFNDLYVVLVGIPLIAFVIPLIFFGDTLDDGITAYWPKWKIAIFFTTAYWLAMREAVIFFRARWPEHQDTYKRIIWMVLTIIVAVFALNSFCYEIHDLLLPDAYEKSDLTPFDYAKGTYMVAFFITSLYEGVYFYHRWKLSLLETERLRRENITSQLDALKSQVNPHFLFNSLNTLTYLIPEDSDRAVGFVQQLSKVYRYILEIRDRSLITVAEELDFLDAYLFLLKERFGANLQLQLRIDPAAKHLHMIPLSLQMLLENAIKHNVVSSEKPLKIELVVGTERGSLLLRNRLQPKNQAQASTKVGLENIRRRYAFYTNMPVLIKREDGWFSVELPLLRTPELADITEASYTSPTLDL